MKHVTLKHPFIDPGILTSTILHQPPEFLVGLTIKGKDNEGKEGKIRTPLRSSANNASRCLGCCQTGSRLPPHRLS